MAKIIGWSNVAAAIYLLAFVSFVVAQSSPCDIVKCGYGANCQVIDGKAQCKCPGVCPQYILPICGSDGRTYGNACFMRVSACNAKKNVHEVSQGACPTTTTAPTSSTPVGSDPTPPPDCAKLCPKPLPSPPPGFRGSLPLIPAPPPECAGKCPIFEPTPKPPGHTSSTPYLPPRCISNCSTVTKLPPTHIPIPIRGPRPPICHCPMIPVPRNPSISHHGAIPTPPNPPACSCPAYPSPRPLPSNPGKTGNCEVCRPSTPDGGPQVCTNSCAVKSPPPTPKPEPKPEPEPEECIV